jgi:hypothetical protein
MEGFFVAPVSKLFSFYLCQSNTVWILLLTLHINAIKYGNKKEPTG